MTEIALTEDKPVGQETVAGRAILLVDHLFVSVASRFVAAENVLSDFCLPLSSSSSEVIEVTVEPLIDSLVDLMIVIADLFGSFALFKGLCLCSSSILISSTDI